MRTLMVFGLMVGVVVFALRAVAVEVFARHALRAEEIARRQFMDKREVALTWALRSAACAAALALCGLWHVAQVVTR